MNKSKRAKLTSARQKFGLFHLIRVNILYKYYLYPYNIILRFMTWAQMISHIKLSYYVSSSSYLKPCSKLCRGQLHELFFSHPIYLDPISRMASTSSNPTLLTSIHIVFGQHFLLYGPSACV